MIFGEAHAIFLLLPQTCWVMRRNNKVETIRKEVQRWANRLNFSAGRLKESPDVFIL